MMEKELKMRGAPANEKPKSPIHKAFQKETQQSQKAVAHEPEHPPTMQKETAVHDAPAHEETHDEPAAHKVAVITGASSGIGKAIALHLASSNYNLFLIARKQEPLHEVQQELAKYKVRTIVRECDVTKIVQVHEAINQCVHSLGRIDVLVNSAGFGVYGDIDTMRLEDINNQMVTNYFGTVLFIKECLPKLKESHGTIVNIASVAGLIGMPRMAAYSASKHAVVGLSESLRYELHGTGVAVCCVCPGKVKTNFFKANESFKDVDWANDEDYGIEPSKVATAVQKAIVERKFLYVTPPYHQWQLLLGRLLPHGVSARMMRRQLDK
jgi:short-subunit dehydrogenase